MNKLRSPTWKRIAGTLAAVWLGVAGSTAFAQVVVVVNQDAPVADLNLDTVRQIFLGRLQMFPGTKVGIQVLDQRDSSPAFTAFYERVVQKSAMQLTRYRASFLFSGRGSLPKVLDSDLAVLEAVQRHPGAIGYVQRDAVAEHPVRILLELP